MMESIEQLRKDADMCTQMAGAENEFETVWITKDALIKDIDAIEREVESNYVELPKDADGELIHVGDKLHPWNARKAVIEVRAIIDSNTFATWDSEIHFVRCTDPSIWVHHKPPTVEDVLEDYRVKYYDLVTDMECKNITNEEYVQGIKELNEMFAAKLQLREAE